MKFIDKLREITAASAVSRKVEAKEWARSYFEKTLKPCLLDVAKTRDHFTINLTDEQAEALTPLLEAEGFVINDHNYRQPLPNQLIISW